MTNEGESAVCRSIRFMIVAAAVERYGIEKVDSALAILSESRYGSRTMSDADEEKRIRQDIVFRMWQGMTDRQFQTQVFTDQAQAVIPDVMKRLFGDEGMVKDIKRYCEIILEGK